jgi:hypothetical protein
MKLAGADSFEGFRSQAMAGSRATRMDLPEEWLYDSRWDLKPLPGSQISSDAGTFLPDTSEIIKHLQQAGRRESSRLSRVSRQQKLERGLNSLARAYLLEAFAKLGCTSRSDRPISTDSVSDLNHRSRGPEFCAVIRCSKRN